MLSKCQRQIKVHVTKLDVFHVNVVLISYCCWNKLAHIWWLQTAQMCYVSSFGGQKSEMDLTGLTSLGMSCSSLEALGENPFSCLFQLLEAATPPWILTSFHLQHQQWSPASFLYHITTLGLSCLSLSRIRTCDSIGSTQIARIISHLMVNSLATSVPPLTLISPLPCNRTYSQFPGTDGDTFRGGNTILPSINLFQVSF